TVGGPAGAAGAVKSAAPSERAVAAKGSVTPAAPTVPAAALVDRSPMDKSPTVGKAEKVEKMVGAGKAEKLVGTGKAEKRGAGGKAAALVRKAVVAAPTASEKPAPAPQMVAPPAPAAAAPPAPAEKAGVLTKEDKVGLRPNKAAPAPAPAPTEKVATMTEKVVPAAAAQGPVQGVALGAVQARGAVSVASTADRATTKQQRAVKTALAAPAPAPSAPLSDSAVAVVSSVVGDLQLPAELEVPLGLSLAGIDGPTV
ncbi:unnamed protein product, partial [Discosporangium mesarthrocarpum]